MEPHPVYLLNAIRRMVAFFRRYLRGFRAMMRMNARHQPFAWVENALAKVPNVRTTGIVRWGYASPSREIALSFLKLTGLPVMMETHVPSGIVAKLVLAPNSSR
jgi:hypothetical protein